MAQKMALGADGDGRLAARPARCRQRHVGRRTTSSEFATEASRSLYATPSMRADAAGRARERGLPTRDARPGRGARHLGAGERDGRARAPARHRSARPAACQLRRGRSGDGRAMVVEEAARSLRGRRAAVRLARAAARAAARRRLAGRPGHGELHDGHAFATPRPQARVGCEPTATRSSRPARRTSAPGRSPSFHRSPPTCSGCRPSR